MCEDYQTTLHLSRRPHHLGQHYFLGTTFWDFQTDSSDSKPELESWVCEAALQGSNHASLPVQPCTCAMTYLSASLRELPLLKVASIIKNTLPFDMFRLQLSLAIIYHSLINNNFWNFYTLYYVGYKNILSLCGCIQNLEGLEIGPLLVIDRFRISFCLSISPSCIFLFNLVTRRASAQGLSDDVFNLFLYKALFWKVVLQITALSEVG